MDDGAMTELEVRIRAETREQAKHFAPAFDYVKTATASMKDIRDAIGGRQKVKEEYKLTQKKANVKIASDAPVLDVWLCDLHLGSGDTDHDLWQEHFETIMRTPGVYVTLGSNLIDNAIPSQFPDGMLQNIINPEEQVLLMRGYVQELDGAGKVLGAIVSPCHEGWTWKKAGQDINRLLFGYDGRKFPVLENGSRLDVVVNNFSYREALYHQIGPFNSNLNRNNGTQRMRQLQHSSADIVKKAHHHTAEAMMNFCDKGDEMRPVCYISGGCYKLDDQWAGGKGYVKGEPGGQAVRLYHDQKRMLPYLDFQTAIEEHVNLSLVSRARRAV